MNSRAYTILTDPDTILPEMIAVVLVTGVQVSMKVVGKTGTSKLTDDITLKQ